MFESTTTTVKSFVARHKIALSVTTTMVATATVCIMMNQSAIKQHNDFLTEKGLFDEFYYMSDDPTDM